MQRYPFLAALVSSCILTAGCYQDTPSSPQTALRALTELLHDRDALVRRTAADALGKIGDPSAEPFLVSALHDADPAVREAAARSLGRLSTFGMDAGRALVGRLGDPDHSVQRASAQALGAAEGSSTLAPSVTRLLVSPDNAVRQEAAHTLALVDAREPSVTEALVTAAQDADSDVRQWAVAALGESGTARAVPALMDRLRHDPVEAVRGEAAYRLRFVGTESVARELDAIALEERSPFVRVWVESSRAALRKESESGSAPRPSLPTAPVPSDRYP